MPHIIDLPDDSELHVPLVPLSSSTLMAGAFHLGRQCDQANKVSEITYKLQNLAVMIMLLKKMTDCCRLFL